MSAAVEFHHRSPHRDKPRLEVRANRPVLLIAIDAAGEVYVFMAHDDYEQADALVDELQERDDIGPGVRILLEAERSR